MEKKIVTGDFFINITQDAQTLRSTINKRYLLKLRSVYKAKTQLTRTSHKDMIFTNAISDRGMISKELKKLVTKTPKSHAK